MKQDESLKLLETMYLIRFFEETAGMLYKKGRIKGGIHASIGQEAIETGVIYWLKKSDYIASNHRGHGHHIAKGADLNRLMAELLAKESGYCRGRGGSMHVTAVECGSLGAFPIVGAGVPCAVGAALSLKMQGKDAIVAAFFGDGALGQGTVFEAMNLAVIWKLPVLFVCENNQYAVSTSRSYSSGINDIARMAEAHGIKAVNINGQELPIVLDATKIAVEHLHSGAGPYFIHAETYRFEGHYIGEPEVYRSRESVAQARKEKDPILHYRALLLDEGIAEDTLNKVEECARGRISAALQFAEESSEPAPEEYDRYVYTENR